MADESDRLSKTVLIGIGGCGVSMLESWLTRLSDDVLCIAIDRDEKYFCRKKKFKLKMVLSNVKCIGSTVEYSKSAQIEVQTSVDKQMPILTALLQNRDRVIILAGLGGVIGTWGSQYICNRLISMGKKVVTILVMPFEFASGDMDVIDYALPGFDGDAHRVFCFNEYLIKHVPKNTSLLDALDMMNEKVFELLTMPD